MIRMKNTINKVAIFTTVKGKCQVFNSIYCNSASKHHNLSYRHLNKFEPRENFYSAALKHLVLAPYLARPLHALPDGEVDHQPGQGQCASQGPADGAGLPQASRHLVHVPPRGGRS